MLVPRTWLNAYLVALLLSSAILITVSSSSAASSRGKLASQNAQPPRHAATRSPPAAAAASPATSSRDSNPRPVPAPRADRVKTHKSSGAMAGQVVGNGTSLRTSEDVGYPNASVVATGVSYPHHEPFRDGIYNTKQTKKSGNKNKQKPQFWQGNPFHARMPLRKKDYVYIMHLGPGRVYSGTEGSIDRTEIQVGCKELQARRYITDGFCTSHKPIQEVVCTGHCLSEKNLPWYAEFVKTIGRHKLKEWHCVEDSVQKRPIELLCKDGTKKHYNIKVVKSCKCKKQKKRHNRTSVDHETDAKKTKRKGKSPKDTSTKGS